MQMVKKVLITLLVLFLSLVVFAPKERLFFLLEEKLQGSDVVISNEMIDSGLLGLDITQSEISFKGVPLAKVERMDIFTLLFYSSVELENMVLDETSRSMLPISEFNLSLSHNLLAPKSLNLTLSYQAVKTQAKLKFLDEGKVRVEVEDINGSDWLKPLMKKDENGWYYEADI